MGVGVVGGGIRDSYSRGSNDHERTYRETRTGYSKQAIYRRISNLRDAEGQDCFRSDDHDLFVHFPPLVAPDEVNLLALPIPVLPAQAAG